MYIIPFYFKGNAVVSMTASFPQREFEPVVRAIAEIHGSPASASQAEITWTIGEIIGTARPRGNASETADVTFTTQAAIAGLGKRIEDRNRLRSRDM